MTTRDTSGNIAVDFVWGGMLPMQPNEDRVEDNASPVVVVAADAAQNYDWSGYSVYPSKRLNPSLDNHETALSEYAGFPGFTPSAANYMVTAVSADGTTVTYTSQNNFQKDDKVTITGLPTSAFNLSDVTIASADALKFTVTNAATGTAITGARGRAEDVTNAPADGAYVGGVFYVDVPDVRGLTTAIATDDLRDASLVVTVATAATNAAGSITDIDRTAGSTTVELTGVGFTAAYPVGTKITVASTGTVDGTWTVTGNTSTNKIRFTSNASTVLTSGTGSIVGVAGTIKSQSIAGGAASISSGAAITITPYAVAS
jgi:hypothetical protein